MLWAFMSLFYLPRKKAFWWPPGNYLELFFRLEWLAIEESSKVHHLIQNYEFPQKLVIY